MVILQVAVSTAAREVVGSYVVDDTTMQITISLPNDYPLGTIKVSTKKRVNITRTE